MENEVCKYDEFVNKMKERLGTENITVSITPMGIIVDRTDKLECVVEMGIYYDAPYLLDGDNSITQITAQDMIDFNLISDLSKLVPTEVNTGPVLVPIDDVGFQFAVDVNRVYENSVTGEEHEIVARHPELRIITNIIAVKDINGEMTTIWHPITIYGRIRMFRFKMLMYAHLTQQKTKQIPIDDNILDSYIRKANQVAVKTTWKAFMQQYKPNQKFDIISDEEIQQLLNRRK